jgi:hypothetical protein
LLGVALPIMVTMHGVRSDSVPALSVGCCSFRIVNKLCDMEKFDTELTGDKRRGPDLSV